MALTEVLKPFGVQPVGGGSLIYQWTEASIVNKENYRVEIIFNGLTLPTFTASPDANLVVKFDVAQALRNALLLTKLTTDRFKNTYVKYQAKWDGTAVGTSGSAGFDTQISLNANVIYFYTGNDNVINHRAKWIIDTTGGQFLVPTTNHYQWGNRVNNIEFICPNNFSTGNWGILQVPGSGTNVNGIKYADTAYDFQLGFGGVANQMISQEFLGRFGNDGSTIKALGGTLGLNRSGAQIANNEIKAYFGSADIGQGFAQSITTLTPSGAVPNYLIIKTRRAGNPTYSIKFVLVGISAGLPNEADVKATLQLDLRDIRNDIDLANSVVSPVDYIWLDFNPFNFAVGTQYALLMQPQNDGIGDANNYYSFFTTNVNTYGGGNVVNKAAGVWTNDVNKDLNFIQYGDQPVVRATIPVTIMNECKNPIYVRFHNNLGGITKWLFDYNQEYMLRPIQNKKFKIIGAYATDLEFATWLMLNELNTTDMEYNDNYKIGQFIEDVTDYYNPQPLVALEVTDKSWTKQYKHTTELFFRYPMISNIQI